MRRVAQILGFAVIVIASGSACRQQVADLTPALTAHLREIVDSQPPGAAGDAVWADVRKFYAQREDSPAWVTATTTGRAAEALRVLQTAGEHGFGGVDYGQSHIADRVSALGQTAAAKKPDGQEKDPSVRLRDLAELDVRITTGLLAFGRDVSVGRTKPTGIDPERKAQREVPDFAAALNAAAGSTLDDFIVTVRPRHPEYAALQNALAALQAQGEEVGWPLVPAGTYAPGDSDPAIVTLRRRLAAAGHLIGPAAASASPIYSPADAEAVKTFQALHALKVTGAVDAPTVTAMNIPLEQRIRQVALNLERWRWMPDDLGDRHLLVNIPYFHVVAREDGKAVMDIRVVVGKPSQRTPVFSSQMSTVVFSPYWNIPESIVLGETAPAVARDPNYLARNNIEVRQRGAATIDASSIDWSDKQQVRQLSFRQLPGPGNALGRVKFLFPNEHDVYLHDTPADSLFARPLRALSHGCVRVEEPEALAKYILRDYPEWNDARILAAMHSGIEKHVRLAQTIPVHLVYFTAWVDEHGGLHFQPDIYGYDTQQQKSASPS